MHSNTCNGNNNTVLLLSINYLIHYPQSLSFYQRCNTLFRLNDSFYLSEKSPEFYHSKRFNLILLIFPIIHEF